MVKLHTIWKLIFNFIPKYLEYSAIRKPLNDVEIQIPKCLAPKNPDTLTDALSYLSFSLEAF
jgi:hypothetical protein